VYSDSVLGTICKHIRLPTPLGNTKRGLQSKATAFPALGLYEIGSHWVISWSGKAAEHVGSNDRADPYETFV